MLQKRSFELSRSVMRLVDKFPKKRTSWVIADQLLRSTTSIGANIIEAQAASSKKDFVNFLNHALKSGNETVYWLSLSKDLDRSFEAEIDEISAETNEIVRILGSSISTIRGKRKISIK